MTRLKILLTVSIFVILYALYYWALPFVINIKDRVPLIKSYVSKNLGFDVDIKNPDLKMSLIPAVWVEADYFGVVDKKASPLFIVKPKIKIRLLPLLFGKVQLAYFSCDKIKADLRIDKDNRFFIGNHLILKSSNPTISIEDSQMDVEDYEIKLNDEPQNKNILLKGDYLNLEKYNSKKHIKLSTSSRLRVNQNYSGINLDVDLKLPLKKTLSTNDIVFDGTVTNLHLDDFSTYIRKITNNKIKKIGGVLNIKADTNTLIFRANQIKSQVALDKFLLEGENVSINSKNKLTINSICYFSDKFLNIDKLEILSKNINIKLKGKINNVSSKNPYLDLSALVTKSKVEDFTEFFPNIDTRDFGINLAAIKKYGFFADVDGNLSIKGKSDQPELRGKIIIQNAYVVKPLPAPTPKAVIKLDFSGKHLTFDVVVPASLSEKVFVKGKANLRDPEDGVLDITSTKNVNLKTAESVLLPIREIFCFELGPLPVMKVDGIGNINLKVKGSNLHPHLFGAFNFRNTMASFNGIDLELKNGEGRLSFENEDTHFVTRKAFLDNKPIKVDGKCSLKGVLDYDVIANGQDFKFLLNVLGNSPMLFDIKKESIPIKKADGKLNVKLKLSGRVKNLDDFIIGKTVTASGEIKLLGNSISLSNLQIPIKSLFGNIKFKNTDADFDLYSIVNKTRIYVKGKIRNNKLNLKAKLDNLYFMYSNVPVKIFSGSFEIRNDKLTLYKVNGMLDSMPVLIDGFVTNIFKDPEFNLYVNSKPTQVFIEKYINKNALYPLKIKGDIIYSSRIKGTKDSFNAKTEVNMEADSNIYYMGSTLGDANNPIRIFADMNVAKNSIYINNFQYDKLIASQNNKEFISGQLNAKGQINVDKKNIYLKDFRVKTQNPTDAKIFNLLFKKPFIKQGLFTSDITMNGPITTPKMLGNLTFTGIDMPLLDTTIKDISLDFKNDNIDIKTKGEIFTNTIVLFATMKNSFKPPFIFDNVDIYLGNLDVNEIVKSLNKIQLETNVKDFIAPGQDIDVANLIIKKAKIKADSVFVRNIFAKDLTADFSLNERLVFSLDNFKFSIAQGTVKGDFKYNFLNSKSSLQLNVNNVNANSMAETLFDLPNQIFGSLSGSADITCNGKTHKTCMDTLTGRGGFVVADGRMPKLGSLEYLLKAANLVKSGVTGLTVNGLIDLLSPLKTGQFDNINGSFEMDSGIANSIQIFSKGKDLSLFLTGTYNFQTLIADLEVFGRLSKKITNVLGPVGNTSLNTLFNTIPGLNLDDTNKAEFLNKLNKIPGFELNEKDYRVFSVKIYGDINGDNYVQSFKWIE